MQVVDLRVLVHRLVDQDPKEPLVIVQCVIKNPRQSLDQRSLILDYVHNLTWIVVVSLAFVEASSEDILAKETSLASSTALALA